MGRWKVPDVVPREKGCVAHAISVMRLALGYKTGWPEGVEMLEYPTGEEVGDMALASFPGRHVMAIRTNGSYTELFEGYLLAFCYVRDGSKYGHMVMGYPDLGTDQELDVLVAVSIDRRW